MPAQLGHDAARVHGVGVDARAGHPAFQPHGEQDVRRLRLSVGHPLVVIAVVEERIVEIHRAHVMTGGAQVDDSRGRRRLERGREQTGEQKVAHVIGGELHLPSRRGARQGARHDPGVVD